MDNNVSIVVSSCDLFEDCWAPFIHSMRKYWPDCEWPVYVISNHKAIDGPEGFSFIKVGEDLKFASNLKRALDNIRTDYIIYLQEDFFLDRRVDNEAIKEHVAYCMRNGVDYMRLGFKFMNGRVVDKIYAENNITDAYSLCLQAAIWKRETLYGLLLDNWSGWDFEYKIRQYVMDNHICLKILELRKEFADKGIRYVTGTAVRKGRWTISGYDFLREEGFPHLLDKREREGYVLNTIQGVHGFFMMPCRALARLMRVFNWNF